MCGSLHKYDAKQYDKRSKKSPRIKYRKNNWETEKLRGKPKSALLSLLFLIPNSIFLAKTDSIDFGRPTDCLSF